MILADVNVLIYALRPDAPQHARSRAWVRQAVEARDRSFGVSRLVLSSIVRITTNRKTFPDPETVDEAFSYCHWLMSRPNSVMLEPGERHWSIFERLCYETNTTGPRVTDAWLAALAIEHECEWVTFDRDFARFPGLRWSVPK